MKSIFLLFFLFLASVLFSQTNIKIFGLVENETNTGVPNVSVYLDGSSIQTKSDADGNFELNLNTATGNLIFKKEGFTTVIYPLNRKTEKLRVILTKEAEIEEIKLLGYSDKLYTQYIDHFLHVFIGHDAATVKIKNPKDLIFAYDKTTKTLYAKAKKNLQIENKFLGYLVEYNLMSFKFDQLNHLLSYSGSSFFTEMPGKEKQKIQWHVNRLNSYYGSIMHFFREVYKNQVSESGFIVNQIIRIPNPKYPKEEELQKLKDYRELLGKNINTSIEFPQDIMDIQKRKSNETPFALAVTKSKIPTTDYIKKEDQKTILSYKDLLGVVYNKKEFEVNKKEIATSQKNVTISSMLDPDGKDYEIYPDGNYSNPTQLILIDDWINYKLSKTLPLDYIPDR